MRTLRMPRTEIVRSISALLMLVGQYIRHPFKIGIHSCNPFRVLRHQPIPVAIRTIMIRTARRPWLLEFPGIKVTYVRLATGRIHPISEPVYAIRISSRI